jgi:hypothetical protein
VTLQKNKKTTQVNATGNTDPSPTSEAAIPSDDAKTRPYWDFAISRAGSLGLGSETLIASMKSRARIVDFDMGMTSSTSDEVNSQALNVSLDLVRFVAEAVERKKMPASSLDRAISFAADVQFERDKMRG